jgi:hypothetical protein
MADNFSTNNNNHAEKTVSSGTNGHSSVQKTNCSNWQKLLSTQQKPIKRVQCDIAMVVYFIIS